MIFNIIYNITIYPIEFIIETLFYLFTNILKYSYPASLFLLSLSVTLLSLPLYMIAEKWKKEEEKIQARMKPDIEHIKKNFKGDERFLLIQACYRIYKYKTIYAFRGTLGLLIQIPFFLAAYNFIHNLDGLNGVTFLLIKNLSKPDALIKIGNISINVLPFIMTLFSLLSGLVYAKKGNFKENFKENIPVYVIPLIFLILLYTSPSGLLFYWTLNCLFSLIKNLILKHKLEIKNILSNKQLLLKIYSRTIIIIACILFLLAVLGNIERKGYLKDFAYIENTKYTYNIKIGYHSSIFKNSDIYGVTVSKDKLDSRIKDITFNETGSPFGKVTLNNKIENVGNIEIRYKLFVKSYIFIIFIILSFIYILIKSYKNIQVYTKYIFNILNNKLPSKSQCKKITNFYNIFIIIVSCLLFLLAVLGNIERKGYLKDFSYIENTKYTYNMKVGYHSSIFKNSDIYGVTVTKNKLDSRIKDITFNETGSPFGKITLNNKIENVGNIEVRYKLFVKSYIFIIFILLFIAYFLLNSKNKKSFNLKNIIHKYKISNFKLDIEGKKRFQLLIISCLIITVLSGLFIPSSLIVDSPNEFRYIFYLISNNISMSIGLFLFYPIFIYILFSEKIKNILTFLSICSVSIILINTFIMVGNYKNINFDFTFDDFSLLKSTSLETILNFGIIVTFIMIIIIIIKKKNIIIINIYNIVLIALIIVSSINIFNISKEISNNKSNITAKSEKIFNASTSGENIFVFILDRAMPSHWMDALNNFPEYKSKFDGFIFFPNNVTLGTYTANSIMAMAGGYEYSAYELTKIGKFSPTGIPIPEKINEGWLKIPLCLEKYGYKSSLLDPKFASITNLNQFTNVKAYNNTSISDYALDNYFEDKEFRSKKFIRFSIFRMLPINCRYFFYQDSNWFLTEKAATINTSIINYSLLQYTKKAITIHNNGNYYNILHNDLTHEPYYIQDNFLPSYEPKINEEDLKKYNSFGGVVHYYVNVAAMNIIIEFINYLKSNNIYDNTKIIIASDHGSTYTTTFTTNYHINQYNSLLLYKDFNSHGEIKINTNFMTAADIPYLTIKHIPDIKDITNYNKDNGVFITAMDYTKDTDIYDFYHLKNNVLDISNWSRFKMNPTNKEMVEVKFKINRNPIAK